MRCPFCGFGDTQVKDSRASENNAVIRRRRVCNQCGGRFTTFERIQLRELVVVKADGKKEPFKRDKIASSMHVALRKRPTVSGEQLDDVIDGIVRQLESRGENEIPSQLIGERVMDALEALDKIAYVRFASVYRDFKEVDDFKEFIVNIEE